MLMEEMVEASTNTRQNQRLHIHIPYVVTVAMEGFLAVPSRLMEEMVEMAMKITDFAALMAEMEVVH